MNLTTKTRARLLGRSDPVGWKAEPGPGLRMRLCYNPSSGQPGKIGLSMVVDTRGSALPGGSFEQAGQPASASRYSKNIQALTKCLDDARAKNKLEIRIYIVE